MVQQYSNILGDAPLILTIINFCTVSCCNRQGTLDIKVQGIDINSTNINRYKSSFSHKPAVWSVQLEVKPVLGVG
jgi:hypothetical protein